MLPAQVKRNSKHNRNIILLFMTWLMPLSSYLALKGLYTCHTIMSMGYHFRILCHINRCQISAFTNTVKHLTHVEATLHRITLFDV